MNKNLFAAMLMGCALTAGTAMAQQSPEQQGKQMDTAIQSTKVVVPIALETKQMMKIQETLNKEGFAAGPVNGMWDKQTSAAIHNYQVKQSLEPTGVLDGKTLKALKVKLESSGGSSSGGSSGMTEQQAQQKLQGQGYSQVQLSQQGQNFSGTAAKSGQQYQVAVSQDGQVQAQPRQ